MIDMDKLFKLMTNDSRIKDIPLGNVLNIAIVVLEHLNACVINPMKED